VGEHRGTITEVGLTATTIQTLVGDVVMSNSVLAAQIVLVRSRIPRPEPTPETTAQATEGPEALESREEIRSPEPSPSPEITATPTAAK
jgi:hypothetical protein